MNYVTMTDIEDNVRLGYDSVTIPIDQCKSLLLIQFVGEKVIPRKRAHKPCAPTNSMFKNGLVQVLTHTFYKLLVISLAQIGLVDDV
jgi:hypothetical protein